MSYTQCIDENSSLLIATAEGRQENTSLREESKAVSHKFFNRRARWTGLECRASGSGCCDPLEKKLFGTILGLLTFLSENDISVQLEGLTCFFLYAAS